MEKFKNFTENLMKVILVPDDSSDSIANVSKTEEPIDVFSKTAADYLGNFDSSCCGEEDCEHEENGGLGASAEGEEAEGSVSVFHDTNGLKISFNGMEFTFPDSVVEKIKSVLTNSESESNEEAEEATEGQSKEESSEIENSEEENEAGVEETEEYKDNN